MEASESDLLSLIQSISESARFCTSGILEIILPGLEVDGLGQLALPISDTQAELLVKLSKQAPYGKGSETIVDTSVRRVWQIEPSSLKILNPQWEKVLDKILK